MRGFSFSCHAPLFLMSEERRDSDGGCVSGMRNVTDAGVQALAGSGCGSKLTALHLEGV